MKKSKERKIKTSDKKAHAPHSAANERQKGKNPNDAVKELFGVHLISERDIENHFGTPEAGTERGGAERKRVIRRFKNREIKSHSLGLAK